VTIWLDMPFQIQFRVMAETTVRFARSHDRDDHALLLSPWPESLLAFEPAWSLLAGHSGLVAIDLPGFGHSQRRDTLLSPRAMGEFLIRAADSFGLTHPHVIGPSVGTAAALFAAARYPARLRSLVVGSGAAAVPPQLGGVLKDWIETPDPGQFRRADPRQLVASALADIERYVLPEAIREDYLSAYEGNRFGGAMRYLRSSLVELPVLRDLLPEITTPVLIIAGACGARSAWSRRGARRSAAMTTRACGRCRPGESPAAQRAPAGRPPNEGRRRGRCWQHPR